MRVVAVEFLECRRAFSIPFYVIFRRQTVIDGERTDSPEKSFIKRTLGDLTGYWQRHFGDGSGLHLGNTLGGGSGQSFSVCDAVL